MGHKWDEGFHAVFLLVARAGPQRVERPVIDMTGLQKNYDFTLSPALPPGVLKENLPPGFLVRPSIFGAVKEQLGPKLQAQKGPVEDYVIDHAEKPAGN